jgi:hypothetical protein
MSPTPEHAVRVVDATDYNDIDRMIPDAKPVSAIPAPEVIAQPEQVEPVEPANLTWIERFWAMLQNTFVQLAAGWRYLFG